MALFGIFLNLIMCIIYAFGLWHIQKIEKERVSIPLLPVFHKILFWTSICLLPFILPN